MTTRTRSKIAVFTQPFRLNGVDRMLPAGDYPVVTDEELIEGSSFPVYRRVSTMIFVPAQSHCASSVEMVTIDPRDLAAAQDRDAATHRAAATEIKAEAAAPRRDFPPPNVLSRAPSRDRALHRTKG